jgi:deazaflavin-dependent oxidoreductase (nitroreductase family)
MAKPNSSQDRHTAIRIPYPKGLLRFAFRAPLLLYRLGLGRILGSRFLELEHRGCRSGAVRRAVIEVIDHDPRRGSFFVVSAWGTKADWYRNILANPSVRITVSSSHFAALAATVTPQEAEIRLRNYARTHPRAFQELGSLLVGESSRDVDSTIRRFVETMPVVEFVPPAPAHPAPLDGAA